MTRKFTFESSDLLIYVCEGSITSKSNEIVRAVHYETTPLVYTTTDTHECLDENRFSSSVWRRQSKPATVRTFRNAFRVRACKRMLNGNVHLGTRGIPGTAIVCTHPGQAFVPFEKNQDSPQHLYEDQAHAWCCINDAFRAVVTWQGLPDNCVRKGGNTIRYILCIRYCTILI